MGVQEQVELPQPGTATAAAEPLQVIEVPPLMGTGEGDPAQPGASTALAPVYYSKDEFHEFLMGMFQLAGLGVALIPPLNRPMQSLVTARQLPSARSASDAIYDLAQKHEWMRWLIDKTSDDLKAFMFIGLFGLGVGIGVKEELAQRANLVERMEREYVRETSDEKEPKRAN